MNCNQCKGPTIINHAGGNQFHYCRQCKIEVKESAIRGRNVLRDVLDKVEPILVKRTGYVTLAPKQPSVPSPWSPTWVNQADILDKVSKYGRSRTDQHGSIDIQYSEDGQTWGYRHSWMPAQDQCYICGMTGIDTLAEPLYKYICKPAVKPQGIQSPIAMQIQDRLKALQELVRQGLLTQDLADQLLARP